MKLGILSDIHERVDQLRPAIDVLRANDADSFIVLGDTCDSGTRVEETTALLREVGAIGVWGNHDYGLCTDQSSEIRQQYSTDALEFMNSLQPRLEIGGCLFTHIEPWLDPNKIEDLWYFDGLPETQEKLNRSFAAMPHRVMFIGHYHSWLVGSTTGIAPWNGEAPITLDATRQHLVVVNAVCHGFCALFDTTKSQLIPFSINSDERMS
jgi:Calcineurin-like phosphoesterase superfamily domain